MGLRFVNACRGLVFAVDSVEYGWLAGKDSGLVRWETSYIMASILCTSAYGFRVRYSSSISTTS